MALNDPRVLTPVVVVVAAVVVVALTFLAAWLRRRSRRPRNNNNSVNKILSRHVEEKYSKLNSRDQEWANSLGVLGN